MNAPDAVSKAAHLFDEAVEAHREAVKYSIRLDPLNNWYWEKHKRLRGELLDLVRDLDRRDT